tara:strand:+ start:1479 stop:2030 length:552 start_codon:yes stop_codon:yes gene_type:complete
MDNQISDETTERFSEIMNTAIEDAARSESERDRALEQRDQISKSFAESERRREMMRVFAPLTSLAIHLYEHEYFMMNYNQLAEEYLDTAFADSTNDENISVPESPDPVDLLDPICRYELVRVLNDIGYIAEAYEDPLPMANCNLQISDRVGNKYRCGGCGISWIVQRGVEETHEPGCPSQLED